MTVNLERASAFMAANARVLDRRRFDLITNPSDAARLAVIHGLNAYRNADGGYGWGLEPDLRAPESQPGGALHAFEAIADAGPSTSPHANSLMDWLGSVSLSDGGLPFALPISDPVACAPFWAQADPAESSLQITAAVATQAHRAARWDDSVRDHPWLETASQFCFDSIRRMKDAPFAYVLSFALQLLDITANHDSEALDLLDQLSRFVPYEGALPVEGGAEGETIHLLDYSLEPGGPLRELFGSDAVSGDLDRLERGQLPDGGWAVDFTSYSEAASWEWRGRVTVEAISLLKRNGRLLGFRVNQ